jgi:hypothetical protein
MRMVEEALILAGSAADSGELVELTTFASRTPLELT